MHPTTDIVPVFSFVFSDTSKFSAEKTLFILQDKHSIWYLRLKWFNTTFFPSHLQRNYSMVLNAAILDSVTAALLSTQVWWSFLYYSNCSKQLKTLLKKMTNLSEDVRGYCSLSRLLLLKVLIMLHLEQVLNDLYFLSNSQSRSFPFCSGLHYLSFKRMYKLLEHICS